ncbi:serine-repeat antigen 6 [Plasmodium gonderi]|uniref:Putative papain-like cysteine prorease n=1 Tax=Plasmodium gonderi TaxID=77519 RepID=F1SZ33_PLAGO|nr:serine-repeat antigen 6 [Plasmodium gonderi]BAK08491.1 putative papain-like cysteine prorease [Plasmodium gonderi]GAW79538.1 serine-repeat antigen 6 [Plasmodium gonderi]
MKTRISLFLILCAVFSNSAIKCEGGTAGAGTTTTGQTSGISTENIQSQGGQAPQGTGEDTSQVQSPGIPSGATAPSPPINSDTPRAQDQIVTSPSPPSEGTKKEIQIKSSLLKGRKGVVVTGSCNASFLVFFVPYLFIDVDTESSNVYMGTDVNYLDVTEYMGNKDNKNDIKNVCENNKKFKFVTLIDDDNLILKWKVYGPNDKIPNPAEKVEVRKYKIKNLSGVFTAVQVHTALQQNGSTVFESKNYALSNDIPEKCDAIAANCFLSGNVYIEKCYKCTLKMNDENETDVCYSYVPKDAKAENQETIPAKGSNEDSSEAELDASIDKILEGVYKYDKTDKKILVNFFEAEASLKAELLNYCSLLKTVDNSGILENYELGNEEQIFSNLTKILKKHPEETKSTLYNKLKNVAICMKNAEEWMENKKGLLLPTLSFEDMKLNHNYTAKEGEEKTVSNNNINEDEPNGHFNGVIDLETAEKTNFSPSQFADKMYCNAEYCDRTKEENGCISKINVEDQGNCATSWIFASKLHLESIKCMKGYDHIPSSALYVANCSQKEGDAKCNTASSPLEFLNILDGEHFLPSASDMPYSYKLVGDVCPKPKHHWTNLWNNIKLLNHKNVPNSIGTKGYTAYQSEHFKNNMDEFIKIVKSEIMKKGSVIAYVKTNQMMDYDINGKTVHGICGGEVPDLAVNIIGYGNYINAEGMKKSYWLVRNSWGKSWGDKGNFKVDMHTPADCQHNFIHTAAVFNLDMPQMDVNTKQEPEIYNYYLKNSPDFYNNLYYKNFDALKASASNKQNGFHNNSVIHGQSDDKSQGFGNLAVDLLSSFTKLAGKAAEVAVDTAINAAKDVMGRGAATTGGGGTSGTESAGTGGEQGQPGVASMSGNSLETSGSQPSGDTAAVAGPEQTPTQTASVTPPVNTNATSTQMLHILKRIKNSKMKTHLVMYKSHETITSGHDCSRSLSINPEKFEECVKICNENWSKCEDDPIPGICLSKHDADKYCIFCYV